MKHAKKGLIGLILAIFGITLFVLVVPTVGLAENGLKDYCWAIGITVSTCLGFGLMVISVFGAE